MDSLKGMEGFSLLIVCVAAWSVSALIGYLLGKDKGRGIDGIIWSILLGPVGWLIVALGSDARKKCPFCAASMESAKVTRCKNCGQRMNKMDPVLGSKSIDPLEDWERKLGR